jgi:allophanate hydrolase subunit 2
VVPGPQNDHFTERGLRTLVESTYTVSRQSDRMGMRLEGPAIEHARGFNIASDGTAPGSIQVPGNGLPIVLLADRPTTGGYPKIATVASADVPALGRLRPGATIGFDAIGVEEAEAARRELEKRLAALRGRVAAVRRAR